MSGKIKLQNVRLSFPSLFRKAQFQGDETKYEATFMLDKTEHADKIEEIDAANAKFGAYRHSSLAP